MNIEYYTLYLNYRIILKAKSKGYFKTAGKQNELSGNNLENADFYAIFKTEAENEINLLNKLKIKPVKTDRLINYYGRKNISPVLPQFLHIYDHNDLFDADGCLASKIRLANGIFLTSSRFEGAKIYKPDDDIINNLYMYISDNARNPKFDFICIGTNSEAEIEFIKNFSGNLLLIILPSNPLPNLTALNKAALNCLHISALDPFSKNSKLGFTLRNSLAFHLSQETAILYLSKKSSLSGFIKKFKNAGKRVKIFKEEYRSDLDTASSMKPKKNKGADNIPQYNAIQQFIINSLKKENIAIDNLLKLSNIKFNAADKEIIKAISILEMNSEIERCPGGIIKKI
ncbi:MAG: hypothetical protein M1276_02470 [Deltaproteobacteria bacterium]|nr:hypothetical protein [Deltaproteobacteria bacterium]